MERVADQLPAVWTEMSGKLDQWEGGNDWETGFTPTRAGEEPERQPKPRCAVGGCARVVYKSVVCKKHWDALPIELRLRRAKDAQLAQQLAKADTDVEIIGMLDSL